MFSARDPRIRRRRSRFWPRLRAAAARALCQPGMRAATAAALAVLVYVTFNLAAYPLLRGARLDLTADGVYTLSPTTKQVIASIPEPIRLRLFYSQAIGETVPSLASHAARVRELVEEYVTEAAGGIVLEVLDPQPFSDEEDLALAFGLAPVPLSSGDRGYFGLVGTNTVDDLHVIPLFRAEREDELEHDLTRLVRGLASPLRRRIAVVSQLPGMGDGAAANAPLWLIYDRLGEFFEIAIVPASAEAIGEALDGGTDVLMLVHPRDLDDAVWYAVDQHLMAGGRAIILVDPNSEAEILRRPLSAYFAPSDSGLGPLAPVLGIEMAADQVAADRALAVPVEVGTDRSVDYVTWLGLEQPGRSSPSRIVAELARVHLASAGVLTPLAERETEVTPLLATTAGARTVATARLRSVPDPTSLLVGHEPGGAPLILAARVRGPATSAFAAGPPAGVDGPSHLAATVSDLDVVVIADTDLLDARFWLQIEEFAEGPVAARFADNDMFLVQAIEALAGTIDVSSLRGGSASGRRFDRIEEMQERSDALYRDTEQSLVARIREDEARLRAMTGDQGGSEMLLTYGQQQALDALRGQLIEARRELRAVRHALRRDKERLELWLQFANIALIPIVVLALTVAVQTLRHRSRDRDHRTGFAESGAP